MTTTFVFAALFVISLFAGWEVGGATGNVVAEQPTNPTADNVEETAGINVQVTDSDPILGSENAKITVIEFSDFQCPFCSRANTNTVGGLKQSEEFKAGEVNLVFKHFPLESIHPQARPAAIASVCAQEQGKFYEFHDLLFANQGSLENDNYLKWAGELGLDTAAFTTCLSSSEANAKVTADLQAATKAGGKGTPYFVVINNENGKTASMSGARPYTDLAATIAQVQ